MAFRGNALHKGAPLYKGERTTSHKFYLTCQFVKLLIKHLQKAEWPYLGGGAASCLLLFHSILFSNLNQNLAEVGIPE